jgi:MoaA/NifB/PqqE/SkfB family radical SAM enzyme
MYKYNEITDINLELTEKCNCKCELCPRYLVNGNINPNLKNRELSIDDIKRIFNDIEFIKQLVSLTICGNFGDPICNNDLLNIISYFKKYNDSIFISIHTNGSLRNKNFWEELGKYSVNVIFSIDGLGDTNSIYRQNTSYNKIIENAKSFIEAGGDASWDYIVFEHNEHQIEEAKTLSKKMGFKKFILKKTSRIDKRIKKHSILKNPKNFKYKSSIGNKINFDNIETYLNQTKIKCIFGNQNSIFLSAEGLILPCCWLGTILYYGDHTDEDIKKINSLFEDKEKVNTEFYTIEEILKGSFFKKIKDSWTKKTLSDGKLQTCSYYCAENNSPFIKQF